VTKGEIAMIKTQTADVNIIENLAYDFPFYNKKAAQKTLTHPCFNGCNHENARIHLPVAAGCNVQCNYCVRKYDCVNESRPGVTTRILSPEEAFDRYIKVKEELPGLSVVGIAGPGDALCDFENTKNTLKLIREYDSEVTFCLSTNGLMLPKYSREIAELGVIHVTVTINAVNPSISALIYQYVNYEGVCYTKEIAAALLLQNQIFGLKQLIEMGVVCKVNIVVLKGINDQHIPEVVETVKNLGCYIVNIMPFIPVKGSGFEYLTKTTPEEITQLREECGQSILQMHHCRQCRADAVGCLQQ